MPITYLSITCIVHLVALACFLFLKKDGDRLNNRILAFLMLVPAFTNTIRLMKQTYFIEQVPVLMDAELGVSFLIGPFLYMYVLRSIGRPLAFNVRTALHLVPALLFCLFFAKFHFLTLSEQQEYMRRALSGIPFEYQLYNPSFFFSYTAYLLACLWTVVRHRQTLSPQVSLARKKANWLLRLLTLLFVMNMVIPIIFIKLWVEAFHFVPLLPFVVYFYIVYKHFTQPAIFSSADITLLEKPTMILVDQLPLREADQAVVGSVPETEAKQKYASSDLKPVKVYEFAVNLEEYVRQNKPYLNPDITLKLLADAMGLPSYQLSQVINQHFEKNFFDFINAYRVEAAKLKLADSMFDHYTLEGIGHDCGFNSKSTFYSSFKKHTSQTPAEYKKAYLISHEVPLSHAS